MKWTRFTIHTTVDAVDILSYELDAIGVEGIEIEDHIPLSEEDKQKMFVDILPEPEVVDDVARVSFYLEASDIEDLPDINSESDSVLSRPDKSSSMEQPVDNATENNLSGKSVQEILQQVQEILADIGTYTDIGEGRVTVSTTEDKDWINNWKQYFKPFRASDRIEIFPRWMDAPERAEPPHILRIDPGIAFGTGSHETTKLCIRAIDRSINNGDRVLDIGTGSGILSIVSLLLGASHATAIDIDEIAVKVAKENFDANNIDPNKYELLAGNLLGDAAFVNLIYTKSRNGAAVEQMPQNAEAAAGQTDEETNSIPETTHPGYDLVIANILPDVIVPLTAIVPRFLKKDGLYITSGILATREKEVRDAMTEAGFTDIETTPMGEWVSLTGRFRRT
ncbi:MAG: 50S ribosomal protein L11 methyltransferase [Eubacterium sp.]|nr:50S ribosomal protein L11 methyltransferase [Eubacterium sp.]